MNKYCYYLFFLVPLLFSKGIWAQAPIYELTDSKVRFHSSAPNELVFAYSDKLKGAINNKKYFVFRIDIASFTGFNSPLQREHFNESYMETIKFPEASFIGKIIEDVDVFKDGSYDVRAKGKLTIHGVRQEKIINAHILSENRTLTIKSTFKVLLADYNIKIPRIVSDKVSQEVIVSVDCTMILMQ